MNRISRANNFFNWLVEHKICEIWYQLSNCGENRTFWKNEKRKNCDTLHFWHLTIHQLTFSILCLCLYEICMLTFHLMHHTTVFSHSPSQLWHSEMYDVWCRLQQAVMIEMPDENKQLNGIILALRSDCTVHTLCEWYNYRQFS